MAKVTTKAPVKRAPTKTPATREDRIAKLRKMLKAGDAELRDRKVRKQLAMEGAPGIDVLLAVEHAPWNATVVELGQPGCPWAPGDPAAVVKQAFGALGAKLPRLTKLLANASRVCAAQHAAAAGAADVGGWFLIYMIEREDGPSFFVGGPPNPAPVCRASGWAFPAMLGELFARHDGIGVLCDEHGCTGFDPGVQPSARIACPTLDAHGQYEPTDLLRFTRGVGEQGQSGWCFARKTAARNKSDVVLELDDKHGELGVPVPYDFWKFLDGYLTGGVRSAG